MAYFGGIFFANMGGGGGQNYFQWWVLAQVNAKVNKRIGLVLRLQHSALHNKLWPCHKVAAQGNDVWNGPKGIPGKRIGKNTLKKPWNSLKTPWKYPENTLKIPWRMTFSIFPYALCEYALSTFSKMLGWYEKWRSPCHKESGKRSSAQRFEGRSLQCGFGARSSQILIWSLLWMSCLGGFLPPVFSKNTTKRHLLQNSPGN